MILGYDPGLAAAGAVVYDPDKGKFIAAYPLKTKLRVGPEKAYASDTFVRRCRELARMFNDICNDHSITAVCSEAASWPRHAIGVRSCAAGIAVSVAVAECHVRLPVYTMQPQAIKKALCGKVSASKGDIQEYLEQRYPELTDLIKGDKKVRSDQWDAAAAVVASLEIPELRVLLAPGR